jgi:membrane protein involved in colicin uptake
VLRGSSGSNPTAVDMATVEKATADKEVADAVVAKMSADIVVAAVVKAAADKDAVDAATTKKAVNDVVAVAKAAADKEAVDAATAKKVTDDASLMKGVPEETTGGIGRSRHHTNFSRGDQEACCTKQVLSACQTAVLGHLEGSICQSSLNFVALLI